MIYCSNTRATLLLSCPMRSIFICWWPWSKLSMILWEGLVIAAWVMWRASLMSNEENLRKRFWHYVAVELMRKKMWEGNEREAERATARDKSAYSIKIFSEITRSSAPTAADTNLFNRDTNLFNRDTNPVRHFFCLVDNAPRLLRKLHKVPRPSQ